MERIDHPTRPRPEHPTRYDADLEKKRKAKKKAKQRRLDKQRKEESRTEY